jgi:adenine phosphoribosyltransferase
MDKSLHLSPSDKSAILSTSSDKSLRFLLASSSQIKIDAMNKALTTLYEQNKIPSFEVISAKVDNPNQCPQPLELEGGTKACWDRVDWVLANKEDVYEHHFIVAMENFIYTKKELDSAYLIIYDLSENRAYETFDKEGIRLADSLDPALFSETGNNTLVASSSSTISINTNNKTGEQLDTTGNRDTIADKEYWYRSPLLTKLMQPEFAHPDGSTITYGSLYHAEHPEIPADNWTAHIRPDGRDRRDYLGDGIKFLLESQWLRNYEFAKTIGSKFKQYSDFPTQGVNFLDWGDLFIDATFLNQLIDYIAQTYEEETLLQRVGGKIDYVLGLESRGYMIAVPLALRLGAAFVPIKKAGKTPPPTVTKSYKKEYGEDTFELRTDLPPGKVLIVDDVLATGGSLEAAILLAKAANHEVVEAIVVRNVPALRKQANQTLKDYPVRILCPF